MQKIVSYITLLVLLIISGQYVHAQSNKHYLHVFITEGDKKVATRRVRKAEGETLTIKTNSKYGYLDLYLTPTSEATYTKTAFTFDYRGKNKSNKFKSSTTLKLTKNNPQTIGYYVPHGDGKSKSKITIKIYVE